MSGRGRFNHAWTRRGLRSRAKSRCARCGVVRWRLVPAPWGRVILNSPAVDLYANLPKGRESAAAWSPHRPSCHPRAEEKR